MIQKARFGTKILKFMYVEVFKKFMELHIMKKTAYISDFFQQILIF